MNKKKIFIVIAVILLLLLFVIVAVVRSNDDKQVEVNVTSPEFTNVSSDIMVPGTLQLAKEQLISYSPEIGSEYDVLVKEGDAVEVGTPIIKYSNEQLEIEKEQLQISVESGYLRINQIEKQEEKLKQRKADLVKEIGQKEADKALEAEEQQLWYEKRMANLDLRQILLQQDALEQREEDVVVKSEIDGVVISLIENPSLLDMNNTAIAHIVDKEQFVVQGNISEFDSIHIQEGQKVNLTSDAIIDETWTGVVEDVAFLPLSNNGFETATTAQYPITVRLETGETNQLKPGLQFIMQIVTEEKEALTVPLTAIVREDGDNFVYVVEEEIALKKEVDLGLLSGDDIEVKSGLTKEEIVIIEPTRKLQDGMEVSVID